MDEAPLSGRAREAKRNDSAILAAAREVFLNNPDAPIADVAKRAGVGISALYRRYASKEELLRKLCGDGLLLYNEIARDAVADSNGDPWEVFATFMRRIVEADTHALTLKLAGRFQPTGELMRDAREAEQLNKRLVRRAHSAGVLRKDITADDLSWVFEQIASLHGPSAERTAQLQARYLTLHLDALRGPGRTRLPGPAPTSTEQ